MQATPVTTGKKQFAWSDQDSLWYKDAVIYEVHVRAFYDSDGNGIGDFRGLTQKLPYLQDLGVTTIWLLPFYPSPLKDDGYDIADFTGIHPAYGTMHDFREFMEEALLRGIRVVTELVLNHTSDQHPWFQRARRSPPGSPYRNYYVWSDTQDKYSEARIIFKDFETSNWAWDPVARQYYWHRFYSHQPDLNYENPSVRRAILRTVNFWLRTGVSGLRLDAVPYLYEREGTNCENLPETHAFLKEIRRYIDERFSSTMLLAEANQWPEDAAAYFGNGDECHMAYHFPLMPRMFMSIRMEERFPIIDILQQTPPIPESCQWALFLRNHDELTLEMVTDEERDYMYRVYAHDQQARINLGIRRRLAPLLNNDRKKIELMKGLLFSLPGTPVLYYGDEIGMGDNFYLGDRNGVRTPMQWSADRNAGFSEANPQKLYLPVIIDPEYHYEAVNVATQQSNPDSLLWWMKRLIATRKRSKALGRGSLQFLFPDNRKVLAYLRRYQDEIILVVANLSRLAQYTALNLSEFAGQTPVEVFGHAEFPRIEDKPYLITLSPYAFYWFEIRRQPAPSPLGVSEVAPEIPVLAVAGEWEGLLTPNVRPVMESALLGYLRQRRWFGGKSRRVRQLQIDDVIPMPYNTHMAYLLVIQVEYTEGEAETYLLPVIFTSGEHGKTIAKESPSAVIARLKPTDRHGEEEGVVYDAVNEPAFCSALLEAMSRRRRFKGESGEVFAAPTRVFRRIRGPLNTPLTPVLFNVEQTNTSIAYGDKLILKLFRRLEEGVSPELEVSLFLTEETEFTHAPPLAGSIQYRLPAEPEARTMAIVHGYVPNDGDAWHYTLDHLQQYYERVRTRPDRQVPLPEKKSLLDLADEPVPVVMEDTVGPYLSSARLLGQRTAELHLALAASGDDPRFAPEPFTITYQRSIYHSQRGQAVQALQSLRRYAGQLPEEAKIDAEKVLNAEARIVNVFMGISARRINAMRIRIHGDYHLGQVLHADGDFVIIDFEGEPARALTERRLKRSPMRDVAGMIRSFHYAASVPLMGPAAGLRPEDIPVLEPWARAWYLWISSIFLRSYLDAMKESHLLPKSRDQLKTLLDVMLLDKAIYEIGYELNHRPGWIKLPLQGVLQTLESAG